MPRACSRFFSALIVPQGTPLSSSTHPSVVALNQGDHVALRIRSGQVDGIARIQFRLGDHETPGGTVRIDEGVPLGGIFRIASAGTRR